MDKFFKTAMLKFKETQNSKADIDDGLEEYQACYENLRKECASQGKKDGIINKPSHDQETYSTFEDKVIQEFHALNRDFIGKKRPILDHINAAQIKTKELELKNLEELDNEDEKNRRINALQNKYKSDKTAIQGTNDERIKNDRSTFHSSTAYTNKEKAQEEFNRISIKNDNRKETNASIGHYWALGILVFLAICELPLNLTAFAVVGAPPIETVIMTTALVLAIPIFSHFTGKLIRQFRENKYYIMSAIGIFLLFNGLNYIVAKMRYDFLEEVGGSTAAQLQDDFIFFLVLGLVLYLVGVTVSYFAHDSSQEFKKALDNLKKKNVISDKEEDLINERRESLLTEQTDKIEKLQIELATKKEGIEDPSKVKLEIEKEIQRYKASYDEFLNFFESQVDSFQADLANCISTYRHANESSRNNGIRPQYWDKLPSEGIKLDNPFRDLNQFDNEEDI